MRGASARTVVVPEPRRSPEEIGGDAGAGPGDLTAALHAAQRGDETGFVAIYRDVQPRLLRYATLLVGRDVADDVTAEAWLQISRDLRGFTGDIGRFRGWSARIVHNRAMDVCRADARRPTTASPVDDGDERAGAADTAASALDALSTDLALEVIATLPREQAQAVLLRAVVGLDARTAGEVLGKRAGAVRVNAHRGLRRLARQVRYNREEGRWTLA